MTHICISNLTTFGSDNGLSPGRRQANIWTNAAILLIWTLGTNLSELLIKTITFSLKNAFEHVVCFETAAILPRPQCVKIYVCYCWYKYMMIHEVLSYFDPELQGAALVEVINGSMNAKPSEKNTTEQGNTFAASLNSCLSSGHTCQVLTAFYPSALRAGGVLSSWSGRRAGGCQTCRTHISLTAWWIFSIRSSVELSRPVVVHRHGHLPICPIWACGKNLSNLAQIGSRICGTHISETDGWIDPI